MLLVAAVIAGVLVARDGSSDEGSRATFDALAYIPSDASSVELRGQQQAERRLGLDGVHTGADDTQIQGYLDKAENAQWVANDYTFYLQKMNDEGAAFTALDVDWSAAVSIGSSGSSVHVEGMDAGLDLNAVADDMVRDGWHESSVEGGRRLQADFTAVDPATQMLGSYPASVNELVLLPEVHLMVSGDYPRVLDVIAGRHESMRTADDVTRLLGADELEYAVISRDGQTCTDLAAVLGGQVNPAKIEQVRNALGAADIQTPLATASLIRADGSKVTTTSRLLFGSEQAAAADKAPRTTYLREGTTVATGTPVAHLLALDSITVDGVVETVDYHFLVSGGPSVLLKAVSQREVPPTLCLGG